MEVELYFNQWVSLRKIVSPKQGIKGYVFSRETRCNGSIISILPFRIKQQRKGNVKGNKTTYRYLPDGSQIAFRYEYLLKSEATPCWGIRLSPPDLLHKFHSTLTGGVENGNSQETAIHELEEEAGYKITLDKLIYLGTSFGTKSTDTVYQLYTVDLTGVPQGEALGDGSALEKQSKPVWVLEDDIIECKDPLASLAFLRIKKYLNQ